MDLAGRTVTQFIQNLLREREEDIPTAQQQDVAKAIKEKWCYVCPDIAKEFGRYDLKPAEWIKTYEGVNDITKKPFRVDVGYERCGFFDFFFFFFFFFFRVSSMARFHDLLCPDSFAHCVGFWDQKCFLIQKYSRMMSRCRCRSKSISASSPRLSIAVEVSIRYACFRSIVHSVCVFSSLAIFFTWSYFDWLRLLIPRTSFYPEVPQCLKIFPKDSRETLENLSIIVKKKVFN
jgi:hypothetical protein